MEQQERILEKILEIESRTYIDPLAQSSLEILYHLLDGSDRGSS